MSPYLYTTNQFLETDINTAWKFFSAAKNLLTITPPDMDFKILTQTGEQEIYEGMLIDYTVKPLFGIPVHWQTEIFFVEKNEVFGDRQLKGPYTLWEHKHSFLQKDNGILMKDEIKYQLPFGIIGRITHSILVRKKIEHIFNKGGSLYKVLK